MSSRRSLIIAAALAAPAALALPRAVLAAAAKAKRPARAILVTGGPYARYQEILQGITKGLARLGVISGRTMPQRFQGISTEPVWDWLAREAGGSAIRFLPDGHYSYDWSADRRSAVRQEVFARLRKRRDVDIILTLGSDASLDMARGVSSIPVLSLGSTDPIENGIIASAEDSGKDNVHALVTRGFFSWQIRRFHAIFSFKRLGILAGTEQATRAGIGDAEELAPVLGFTLETALYERLKEDPEEDWRRMKKTLRGLIDQGIDALYLPSIYCPDAHFPEFLEMLTSRAIPAFSQAGSDPVQRGILLGVGEGTLDGYGLFEANVIRRVLAGEKPRKISQVYVPSQTLVINLKTAMQMGWEPPIGLIASAEQAYSTQSPARE